MRPTLILAAALILSNVVSAKASDAIRIAEMGGFLLGNAYRCGVPTARVEDARRRIHRVVAAASQDPTEEAAAGSRFAQIFTASAHPDRDGDTLIPACKVVITQFQRLERHHQQASMN